jgi:hypothetical protein
VCRPRHKIDSRIDETVEIEAEMLRRFTRIGNVFLDVPIDLQALLRVVDHGRDERVQAYWQLVKRPVDHAFDALEPLASNLGFAVARIAHLLGRFALKDGLSLEGNMFETYPAATLQLVWATNKWTEASYKGGKVEYANGQWRGQVSKKKSSKARQTEEGKGTGLATLANYLSLRAPEGFRMDDDEFDAVLCALTGCIPESAMSRQSLAAVIRERLTGWNGCVEPPKGYVVFDRLPENVEIVLASTECPKPADLIAALDVGGEGPQ